MRTLARVEEFARHFGLWEQLSALVIKTAPAGEGEGLLQRLAVIPIKSSRATRRLGSYSHRGGEPLAIRLQFSQERPSLLETFLHELAHACDHLSRPNPQRPVKPHGPGWVRWAQAFGLSGRAGGNSASLDQIRQERLKLVAVCRSCGAEFRRLRRLSQGRHYTHKGCGGVLDPV